MSRPSLFLSIVAAALLAALSGAPVGAHTFDKLTYLTFSGPIQVPGVTLDSGTYRFRLADANTSRKVVQVLSNDGAVVYAMFHTIPDVRSTITEESMVTFIEAPVGVAPPVKSLFYGGEAHGYQFLYPHGGPNMVPVAQPQSSVSYAPIVAAAPPTFEPAPAPIVSEPVTAVAAEPAPPAEPAPALPATGSPVPLVAFGGVASLILGLGVGLFRRHVA